VLFLAPPTRGEEAEEEGVERADSVRVGAITGFLTYGSLRSLKSFLKVKQVFRNASCLSKSFIIGVLEPGLVKSSA
jgi:hypothetical protein